MLKPRSGGFTLIEITIVMAITMALAAIILAGQSTIQGQSQFSGVVNTLTSRLEQVRNAAQTSDNTAPDASGTGGVIPFDYVVWGQLITATPGDSFITISGLYANARNTTFPYYSTLDCSTLANKINIHTFSGYPYTYTIPLLYGVTVSGSSTVQVVFHRALCGGQLMTYNLGTNSPLSPSSYGPLNPGQVAAQVATIQLKDSDGRTANITIDGGNNGAITRTFP